MELFKLLGTIAIDNAEAKKALDETSQKGQQTESKLSKAFGALGRGAAVAGKAIATGLAVGATAMAGLTVKALQASGDLEQNMGGAEAVFGELGKTIGDMKTPMQVFNSETGKVKTQMSSLEAVSKEAYKNMGLSQSDYLATANKMGALFKGAGFETQEALDLSSQAMQRAADVASIMGIDTSAAMEAVAGAAKGNFTMMDNLGVAMNDTAIGAYALEKGINKSTSEMSQQEKIGLAMEMFLDKTSYAAGNYAKENETLAGSLGTAKSALSNFLAGSGDVESLVSSFSNLANVVVNSLKEIAPRLTHGISDIIQQVAPLIPPLLNSLLPILVDGAVSLVNGLVEALPSVIGAIMTALPALVQGVLQLITSLAAAIPQIIQPIIAAIPAIMDAIIAALPTLIPALITGVIQLIMGLIQAMSQIILPIIQALPQIITLIVEALVQNLPSIIQGVIQLVMGVVAALPQIIQALVAAIPQIISLLIQAVLENLPAIIAGLVQVVVGIVAALPQIFMSLIQAIPAVLSGIWDGIKNVFSGLGEWFGEKFSAAKDAAANAWSTAKAAFGKVWDGIKGAFSAVGGWFKDKFAEGKKNAETAWSTAKAAFGKVWDNIKGAFSAVGNWFKEKFTEGKKNAESAWSNAKAVFSKVWDNVKGAFSAVGSWFKEKFTEGKENAENAWNNAKTIFGKVKDKVVSAFGDLGSKLSPLFSKAKDNATKTWSNVKSIFNKLKNGDIVGAFNDLGSLLKGKFSSALDAAKKGFDKIKQIGKDLISGLWNGISDKFSWLTDKLRGFASNVTDKLKSFFGIKSPSTVMRDEVGRYLAQGVVEGILGELPLVEDAAKGIKETFVEGVSDTAAFEKAGSQAANGFAKTFEERMKEDGYSSFAEVAEQGAGAFTRYMLEGSSVDRREFYEAANAGNGSFKGAKINWQEVRQKNAEGLYDLVDKSVTVVKNGVQNFHEQMFAENEKAAEKTVETVETASDETSKKLLDAAQKKLDNFKTYNGMTLAEEVDFWDVVRVHCKEGTDERIEADKKWFEAKKSLNSEMLSAEEKLQSRLDEINQKMLDRITKVKDTFGLFGSADRERADAGTLIANLDEQAEALEEYARNIQFLEYRIGGTELFAKIKSMGIEAIDEITAIRQMTDAQLQDYVNKYDRLSSISNSIAEMELGHETRVETKKAYQDFFGEMDSLGFNSSAMYDYVVGGKSGSEVGSEIGTASDASSASSGQNDLIGALMKILDAILLMDGNMGGHMREALEGMPLEINGREFARVVKAVN